MADAVVARAAHLTPSLVLLVGVGGTLGTAARAGLALLAPQPDANRLTILGINLVGAFLLGVLLEALGRSGPETGAKRRARLFLGTGFCGGFTTYSSLAVASAAQLGAGATAAGVGYAAATLALGAGASVAGVAAGAAMTARRGA